MSDWRKRAKCKDVDGELFFPVGTDGPALLQVEQAKAVCRRCPVKAECLAWAVEVRDAWAVCGGTTPTERRHLIPDIPRPVRTPKPRAWCIGGNHRLGPNDRGRMCNSCRLAHPDRRVRNFAKAQVTAEQFPPVEELVRELPGVADRPRHAGRPVMSR